MTQLLDSPGPKRRARAGRAVRAVTRFVGAVLATSGVLMLADAGLTLAWQEPVSALLAQQRQDNLAHQLDSAAPLFAPPRARTAPDSATVARLAARWAHAARTGHAIGRISLPALHRRYVVVQGTDLDSLKSGPGHYPSTPFPGQPGTVAIAGHRTTYLAPFHSIDALHRGDSIVLEMPYARFSYAVEAVRVVAPDAWWITNRVPGAPRLVLSACHPLYSAAQRIVVFARLRRVDAPG